MAVAGEQLYNKSKQKIYPNTDANVVTSDASGANSTVYKDLVELYAQISKLTGDEEAANNIIIAVHYKRSSSKLKEDITPDTGWSTSFINPTSDYPYTWKRTTISYKGDSNAKTVYEIVASANAEITQTIYRAVSDNSQPIISYINPNTGKEDEHLYDNSIPQYWSEEPVSVSASAPNVFMSTRTKKDGKWGKFSTPAQYGRWAYNSDVVFKYQITSTNEIPKLSKSEEDPGDLWVDFNNKMFTGFLWMINATAVNGQLQEYNNVIWKGPNLMSIVL